MIINLKNVSLRRNQQFILNKIDWQVKPGEHWAIVGLNGSGKTTLLNLVNGYLWPTTGSIEVLGEKFGQVVLQELRQRIGWVSSSLQQQIHEETTAERIILGGKKGTVGYYDEPDDEELTKAVELLDSFRCKHLLGRSYRTLSQGERQKMLIARALMAAPDLLILDEPCTGLDFISREQVLAMIEQITKEPAAPTLIYVSHHIEEILPCFSHTLLLRRGEIYRKGGTSGILTSEQLSDFFQASIKMVEGNQRQWIVLDQNH